MSGRRSQSLSLTGWHLGCLMVLLLASAQLCSGKTRLSYAAARANEKFRARKQQQSASAGVPETYAKATSVDHFGMEQYTGNSTFLQQYAIIMPEQPLNASTPIFLFVAAEDSLDSVGVGSGYYSELAANMSAVQVWPEHRYYGYGDYSPPDSDYEHLTIEQALVDQMELILHIQSRYNLDRAPVIAIGASYSGQQAAWLRIRYPDVFAGAISSCPTFFGAPGLGLDPSYDPYGFAKVATRTASSLAGSAAACPANVQSFFKTIFAMAQTQSGLDDLNTQLNLCDSSKMRTATDVNATLATYVLYQWVSAAQYNYPFETVGSPAYPVRAACEALKEPGLKDAALLKAMVDAVYIFNPVKSTSCLSVPADYAFPTSTFAYQVCTQDYSPFSYDGVSDMFFDLPFSLDATSAVCEEAFGVRTQWDWSPSTFGLSAIRQSSNIFFTAGIYDPYTAASPTKNISDTITAFVFEGAHGQDTSDVDPGDDATVAEARRQGTQNIIAWIAEYNEAIANQPTSNAADLFDLNFVLGGYTSVWNDTLEGSNSSRSTALLNATAQASNEGV